ncbi:phage holin family protein [Peptoniphilus grossensis]|uniref:phage holin family protein n=1 Tax=Peptoniphilus grossensis TaxID=1465756 RepID=UPI004068FAF2
MEVNILFYLKKILFLIILGVKNILESTSDIFNVLILFIVLDYISGIFRAIVEQKLSSQIGYKGILRKIFILVIISVSYLIDEYIIMAETKSMTLIVTMFYISNEGISILENANKIGIPIPNKLKQVLLSVRNEENEFKKNNIKK